MSRVGKRPITRARRRGSGRQRRQSITVKGPLGTMTQPLNRLVKVVNDNGTLNFDAG